MWSGLIDMEVFCDWAEGRGEDYLTNITTAQDHNEKPSCYFVRQLRINSWWLSDIVRWATPVKGLFYTNWAKLVRNQNRGFRHTAIQRYYRNDSVLSENWWCKGVEAHWCTMPSRTGLRGELVLCLVICTIRSLLVEFVSCQFLPQASSPNDSSLSIIKSLYLNWIDYYQEIKQWLNKNTWNSIVDLVGSSIWSR